MKKLLITVFTFVLAVTCFSQVLTPAVDSIPLRDGKKLAADVYLPDTTGGVTYPTILVQTPYNRLWYRFGLPLAGLDLENSPFAYVILDWRCFYGSASACIASANRGEDGFDAVEWIASQSWSDGQVATWGPSALGRVQYMTAKENPPHLVCAVPLVAGPQYSYQEYFPGGAARTEYIEQLDGLGFGMSTVLYANVHYNTLWSFAEANNFYPDSIQIPMLMIGGWYDHNPVVMLEFFEALRTSSPVAVRDKHKLVMGPWVHGGHGSAYVGTDSAGQLNFPEAGGVTDSLALRFLKYYLLDEANGYDTLSPYINFQMGENQWQQLSNWPQTGFPETNIYLRNNGNLEAQMSTAATDSLNFSYDPRDPSPTIGGPTLRADLVQGPYDQSPLVESRADILVFASPVLTDHVRMQGYPKVQLYVSSNCLDSDFAARLTDVFPDGRSMLLVDGIRRARFREGFAVTDTSFMHAGVIYPVEIELNPSSHTFLAGHRIRLDISSSNYPRFDANMNDGGTMYVAGDTMTVQNTILCSSTYPSHLVLPIDNYAVSIHETTSTFLKAYPNPCTQSIYIDIPNEWQNKPIHSELRDAKGCLMPLELQNSENRLLLTTKNLPNGTYWLTLIEGDQRRIVEFVKQ